ncbi:MAG TPA: hypothetical protein PLP17_15355, partial [Oligoflexia bacterium]|nr:hypothetical protein [Oligoflexia bacterium]
MAAKNTTEKSKAKAGRRPNEWVTLFVNGVPLGEVGVFPSKRRPTVKYWVGPKVEAPPDEPDEETPEPVKPARGKKKDEATAAPVAQFLHVKEGKKVQTFALDAEQLADYQAFAAALGENRGIFINSFAPGSAVELYAHDNVFWLTPNADVAYTLSAYRVLQENLFAQHLVGFGTYVSGKGFNFVALAAVEDGLVLLQLPLCGEMHTIGEAIDGKWRSAPVLPQERDAMRTLVQKLERKRVTLTDLDHPLDVYLREVVAGKRMDGEVLVCGSTADYPNLEEALAAAAKAPRRRKTRGTL